MKLYIWEGDGISSGYHDDGTLVVLAESPEEARRIAIESAAKYDVGGWDDTTWWRDGGPLNDGIYGDQRAAIEREPDRVVGLDEPCVVAFNGGGYD